ncbi:hypothetical protein ACFL0Q_07795, partial [Thermodesulfobacteriota bacterium]
MQRQQLFSGCLGLAALLLLTFVCASVSLAGYLEIEGTPLEIHSDEYGAMGAFLWQDTLGSGTDYNPTPFPEGPYLVNQYFYPYGLGSVLFLTDSSQTSTSWGGGYHYTNVTPISHTKPDDWTIVTVFGAGATGVEVTQTITYVNGNAYFQRKWEVVNTGNETFTDVRFIHGGDTYFAGFDSSEGHYDPILNMVYLTNEEMGIAGIMGFYGGIGSSADRYCEDAFSTYEPLAKLVVAVLKGVTDMQEVRRVC